jgi:1,4-dihydroxy-2-naphthoyl-CoA hydrolase
MRRLAATVGADELNETTRAAMPFAGLLGIEVVEASPELVRARLGWDESRCTAGGILHGGALMGLADSAGGLCAFLNLPDGASATATIESKSNFFRPVREGYVEATSRVLHQGRTTVVVETELRDADGRLAAKVTQTQAVL